uniref:Cytochrome b-c1 complex subunit 9 n=1 Tax=Peronospora matthiolae TaxID=2874970 RepID=A0AAV1UNQ7_9STRA
MYSRAISRAVSQTTRQSARMASTTKHSSVNGKGALDGAYKTFMKSTPVYVTTVLLAALVGESVYGSVTNYVWEASNRGRLYHHVDWSKFEEEEEEDEEEEEQEEKGEEAAEEEEEEKGEAEGDVESIHEYNDEDK